MLWWISTKVGSYLQHGNPHLLMKSKVTYQGQSHQKSSCKMGSKCKIHRIWKVEIRLKPNLVYWYNVGTFTCSWSQRSQIKVKGHVRSTCKIAWKCKIWLFCILEDQLEPCDPYRCEIKVRCQFTSSTKDTSSPGLRSILSCLVIRW